MLLQVLYDNIHDKKRILTKKKIQKVALTIDGIVAKTSDGSSYKGDILVGADGNHSTVRDEMWQIADQLSPGWIGSNEHNRKLPESLSNTPQPLTSFPLQAQFVIMGAFLEYLNRARVSSMVRRPPYSRRTNLISSTAASTVVFTGSTSSS
jgi:2-polyprenyl-6-methoxyphenol hydroxylase-like FAD-dependent oxidoreductase